MKAREFHGHQLPETLVKTTNREIAGLFTEVDHRDATGMPRLRETDVRAKLVDDFLATLEKGSASADDAALLRKMFTYTNKMLRTGESVKEDEGNGSDKNIFLRGPAYTLSVLRGQDSRLATVNLSPRLLSSGNFLASLRLHKIVRGHVTDEWLQQRERTERAIAEYFNGDRLDLAAK